MKRMKSASPRCEPRNRSGRTTFRITTAVATPARTSTQKMSASQPNHSWPPSHGSSAPPVDGGDHRHQDRRQQDDEAPEDERVHQPGHEPLQQLPLPEHDLELRLRLARGVLPAVVRDGPRDEAVEEGAAPARAQSGPRHQRGEGERAYALRLPELGADRGHDLVQVADHRVVGDREDRRLGIAVDREDLLRALGAGDVLRRAADPARRRRGRPRSSSPSARPGRCAAASRRSSRRASSRRRRRAGRRAPR